MTLRMVCSCGKTLIYPESYEGRKLPCRSCGELLTVAGGSVRPSTRPWFLKNLLPLVLLLAIPAVVITLFVHSQRPRFSSAAEEYQEGSKEPVNPASDRPKVEQVLQDLVAASKENDPFRFASRFHVRRMLAEIELRGGMAAVGLKRDELVLADELESGLRAICARQNSSGGSWASIKRCTVRFLEGRGEAEAIVHVKGSVISRFRFWLIKEKGTWTIFDFESLDQGIRLCSIEGGLLGKVAKGQLLPSHGERLSELIAQSLAHLARGRPEEALETLSQAQTLAPAPMQRYIQLLQANALQRLGRSPEALLRIDQAIRERKDWPTAVELRGIILRSLGRFEDSTGALEEVIRMIGGDSDMYRVIGMNCEDLGKPDDAIWAYRKGIECDDSDAESLERLKKLQESRN